MITMEEIKIDLSQYSVRTDLAIEAREMVIHSKKELSRQEKDLSQIEGVIIKEKDIDDIKVSLVEVTKQGEQQLGKKSWQIFNVRSTRDSPAKYGGTAKG